MALRRLQLSDKDLNTNESSKGCDIAVFESKGFEILSELGSGITLRGF